MPSYAKTTSGLVHIVAPPQMEFSLCGDSFDIGDTEDDAPGASWRFVASGPVTCPRCAEIIRACRGVRISKQANDKLSDRRENNK